jgi:hypothetical protein
MNNSISPVLEILSKAEKARIEGCRRAIDCLSPAPTPAMAQILAAEEAAFDSEHLRALLENVAGVVRDHAIEFSITDWPFENFWEKLPREPRHSKLLGYFLDPQRDHSCGAFLLGEFFATIAPGEDLPIEGCRVERPESRRIDLHVVRACGDEQRDFAVVIENKVNYAHYRPHQLSDYIGIVHREHPSIRLDRIFAFYLPRTDEPEPSADPLVCEDKSAVQEISNPQWPGQHPRWIQISFKTHILAWLKRALDGWPPDLRPELCESLTHYRNLIRYLIRKHMNIDMQTKLLAQLQRIGDANLPAWTDVVTVKQSAEALQPALESVLRGKLLLDF